jgi:hypothetical protein
MSLIANCRHGGAGQLCRPGAPGPDQQSSARSSPTYLWVSTWISIPAYLAGTEIQAKSGKGAVA